MEYPIADFYKPLEHGWSEEQYEADQAIREYLSVPFQPVKTVRVTYQHVGELKPVPYSTEKK